VYSEWRGAQYELPAVKLKLNTEDGWMEWLKLVIPLDGGGVGLICLSLTGGEPTG
jgi:hypothetical protein